MLGSSDSGGETRRIALCALGGVLFALAWWFIIDAGAYARHIGDPVTISFVHILPGLLAAFGVLFVNSFAWADFAGEGFSEINAKRAKICFALGLVTLFCTLFGALWVAIDSYLTSAKPKTDWTGVAIILNLVCQFAAAIVIRAAHMDPNAA